MKITIATRRRIERLELTLAVGRPIALWPASMSFDEWEGIAMPLQAALQNDSRPQQETKNHS